MRFFNTKFVSLTASLLVGLGYIGNASAVPVNTDLGDLSGVAPAGNPNFTFDAINDSDYSNTIQNWFTNVLYIESQSDGSYKLYVSQEGDFTYWEDPNTSYAGTDGMFNLYAEFDDAGNLEFGEMAIAGRVTSIGVNDPDTILMRANLVPGMFSSEGNLMGFGMTVEECAAQIEIECETAIQTAIPESVYFFTEGNLPDISSLGNNDYQTTLATITTVPIPASIWLMLSALSLAATLARRKKAAAAA
jgi:hypothetical protein